MDYLTSREMRIAGMSIAATVIALTVVEMLGGNWSVNVLRALLAACGLLLVLFAKRLYAVQGKAAEKISVASFADATGEPYGG